MNKLELMEMVLASSLKEISEIEAVMDVLDPVDVVVAHGLIAEKQKEVKQLEIEIMLYMYGNNWNKQ